MEIGTILIYGVVLWFVFNVGVAYGVVKQKRAVLRILEGSEVKIDIQKVGDRLYVYDASTNEFMLHGESFEEVVALLKKHFPAKTCLVSKDTIKELTSDNVKVS